MAGEMVALWSAKVETNEYISNATHVGQMGGVCACPDGMQYEVGDLKDKCKSLACYGGVAYGCGVRTHTHPGVGMQMSCAANLSIADIAFSPSNDLFAVNDETHAVLRWSSAYLESPDIGENKPHYDVVAGHASHPGNALNRLHTPTGVAFDPDGNMIVSDSGNYRLMRWRRDSLQGVCSGVHSSSCRNPTPGEILIADSRPSAHKLKYKKCDAVPGWDLRVRFNGVGDMFALDLCQPRVLRWPKRELHLGPGLAKAGHAPGLPFGHAPWAAPPR
jgi:hypothetical protein